MLAYTYQLQNVETNGTVLFYKHIPISNMSFGQVQPYINAQEHLRMQQQAIERSKTRWSFVRFIMIDVKVVLARQHCVLVQENFQRG